MGLVRIPSTFSAFRSIPIRSRTPFQALTLGFEFDMAIILYGQLEAQLPHPIHFASLI